jgi:hypothetical protein
VTPDAVKETSAIVVRMTNALSFYLLGASGKVVLDARNAIGDLRANASSYIINASLSAPLLKCFSTCMSDGVTFAQFSSVLTSIQNEQPVSLAAVAAVQAGQRFCVSQMGRILVTMTFVSRDDADAAMALMDTILAPLEEDAADEHDSASYQALITFHASVTRYMATEAMLLPRVLTVSFVDSGPTLWLAQRIYQDGSRADEILMENKIVHPLFCPRDIRCLSS